MNVPMLQWGVALAGGAVLGLLYFGGLWLTVHRAQRAEHPYWILAGSFLVRIAGLLAALWLIMSSGWQQVVAAMVGLLIARQVIVLIVWRTPKQAQQSKR